MRAMGAIVRGMYAKSLLYELEWLCLLCQPNKSVAVGYINGIFFENVFVQLSIEENFRFENINHFELTIKFFQWAILIWNCR